MASILNNISKNQQVFFTTHSPILLKNVDLLSIKEIKKEHSSSIISNANFNDIISNL
jgi:predicted ATP-dependent endonuclease of OLD family